MATEAPLSNRKHCSSVVVSIAGSGMCELTNQRTLGIQGGLKETEAKTVCQTFRQRGNTELCCGTGRKERKT